MRAEHELCRGTQRYPAGTFHFLALFRLISIICKARSTDCLSSTECITSYDGFSVSRIFNHLVRMTRSYGHCFGACFMLRHENGSDTRSMCQKPLSTSPFAPFVSLRTTTSP